MFFAIIKNMSTIEQPPKIENSPEHIPNEEKILSVFKKLLNGKEYKEVAGQKKVDGKGIYMWAIEFPDGGGKSQYLYTRKGKYPETEALETGIHVVYLDNTGEVVGGTDAAKLVGEKWEITE